MDNNESNIKRSKVIIRWIIGILALICLGSIGLLSANQRKSVFFDELKKERSLTEEEINLLSKDNLSDSEFEQLEKKFNLLKVEKIMVPTDVDITSEEVQKAYDDLNTHNYVYYFDNLKAKRRIAKEQEEKALVEKKEQDQKKKDEKKAELEKKKQEDKEKEELLYGHIKIAEDSFQACKNVEEDLLYKVSELGIEKVGCMTSENKTEILLYYKMFHDDILVGHLSVLRNLAADSAQEHGLIRGKTVNVRIYKDSNKLLGDFNFVLGKGWDKDVIAQ